MTTNHFCAIDFGTSNSAIAIPAPEGRMRLVELEDGQPTMPTAVFYFVEDPGGGAAVDGPPRAFGRAAVAAYVDGLDGRLMRSMKSILGSSLVQQTTDVGGGRGVKYHDIVAGYLRHLKRRAEAAAGGAIDRAVLGRPVFFVDDDPARDAQAQAALEAAARQVGFTEVRFQYEPIAAAFDYEQGATDEQTVLVADIGGGTSDFSVVRVGPAQRGRLDRRDDILANHGVHVAGTDFDRRIELATVLPVCGYGASGPARPGEAPRPVPSAVYFDLATWHLINTVYAPARVAELRRMVAFYGDPRHHARLMRVVEERLGHDLAGRAEQAKIDVSAGADSRIDLERLEPALGVAVTASTAREALAADVERVVLAAREALRQARLSPDRLDALYFTGGSTGLQHLTQRLAESFPAARAVRGDRFASVVTGLGLDAARHFGTASKHGR